MAAKRQPGLVRDAIIGVLADAKQPCTVAEIRYEVNRRLGEDVPASSVRSYLGLNATTTFRRLERGRYELRTPR
jgi:hypothetical protein